MQVTFQYGILPVLQRSQGPFHALMTMIVQGSYIIWKNVLNMFASTFKHIN